MRGCIDTSNRVVPQKFKAFVPVIYRDKGFFYCYIHDPSIKKIQRKEFFIPSVKNKVN